MFRFCYHLCQAFYTYDLIQTFVKFNVCTTLNALQLPLTRNVARQTQRSVGNECTSGVSPLWCACLFSQKSLGMIHLCLIPLSPPSHQTKPNMSGLPYRQKGLQWCHSNIFCDIMGRFHMLILETRRPDYNQVKIYLSVNSYDQVTDSQPENVIHHVTHFEFWLNSGIWKKGDITTLTLELVNRCIIDECEQETTPHDVMKHYCCLCVQEEKSKRGIQDRPKYETKKTKEKSCLMRLFILGKRFVENDQVSRCSKCNYRDKTFIKWVFVLGRLERKPIPPHGKMRSMW